MADQLNDTDLVEMSDEDLLNLDPAKLNLKAAANTETEQEPATEEEETPADNEEVETDNTQSEETDEDDAANKEEGQANSTEVGKGDDGKANDASDPANKAKETDGKGEKDAQGAPADGKSATTATETAADVDVNAFYAGITAPFQAGGREIKVKSVEEARQLMQMGVGFSKKMAALKPNLKLVKMLEKADLLSEDKINFLIDVASKKPEAISKLVQDAGIDPLDISAEKAGDYKPGNHRISREEQALDEVFDALEGQQGFNRTLEVIGKQWDDDSRALIAQNPKALQDITQHIQAGVFDAVIAKVENERIYGRLAGLSDLEAYRQVGMAMMASGELKHLTDKANPSSQTGAPAKVIVEPNPKKADEDDRRKKRQAASPTRAAAPSTKLPADFNPLTMSDEDLLKLDISKFK
jgi:hypothetical protein